jgi:hypothetical protein
MEGHERRGLPADWIENAGGPVCLHCRRELVAEAAVGALGLSLAERAKLRSSSIIEFEVERNPDRSNSQIANAVHTSVAAVQKARDRLAAPAMT